MDGNYSITIILRENQYAVQVKHNSVIQLQTPNERKRYPDCLGGLANKSIIWKNLKEKS